MICKYPLLINNSPNMKISMEDYKILYYCNGLNDLNLIREKTGFPNLKIMMILKKYVKKGKIRIKYSING
ncbi:MAG: hypothetical protein ACTSPY_08280 [Candidatus Helarchaeota archaeon]